ncbi:GTPase activating protein homolog 1-like isoform X2 [Dysidea avara]|uniref:GTPase activating protein homolog 1-like isoform X2 n=1 Tax=Dysidea avara TaxID=196820 RepID=UPI0033237FE0
MASLHSYLDYDNSETTMDGFEESKELEDGNPSGNLIKYFKSAVKKLEGLFRQCKELSSFLKKRVLVEKEHLRALTKLSFSVAEDSRQLKFDGAIGDNWEDLKEQLKYGTNHRQATITSLETQALQPLKRTVLGELEGNFKKVTHEASQVISGYNTQRLALYKAREKYKKYCSEWEATLMTIYNEQGEEWIPNPRSKLLEKEESLFQKTRELRDEYVMAVETTNWLQHAVFTNSMPELTQSLFNVAKDVVTILTGALQSFAYVETILDGSAKNEDTVSSPLAQLDAETYTLKYLFGGIEMEKVLPPFQFEYVEHLLQDEAAIVHTKKVQYECRAALSVNELLAEGTALAHNIGLAYNLPNPNLVQVCIEYLSRPQALKEEGLFRVPGDVSIIRKYHAAYVTESEPNYQLLRQTIMEELDPNNISGLLKLHMRERPLFSMDTYTAIKEKYDGIENQNVSLLPNIVLESINQSECAMLSQLVGLFCLIIEHSSENRMSPQALSLSCALSFFPQFTTNEATTIMSYCIEHSDYIEAKQKPYCVTPDLPETVNRIEN